MLRRRVVRRVRRRCAAPVYKGFDDWHGADVAVATGWDTVYPVLLLPQLPRARLPGPRPRAGVLRHLGRVAVGARTPTSSASTASPASPLAARPARPRATARAASWFRLGVDHERLPPRAGRAPARHGGLLRARAATRAARGAARRARARRSCTAAGRTSASCCSARRSRARRCLRPRASRRRRARGARRGATAEATVGLCLSLTNYSLIPQEMLACGLPCVDLAGASTGG